MNQFNVLVDFEVMTNPDRIHQEFEGLAIHTEEIGADQYQVGLGINAVNEREAYRRAANLVDAVLLAAGIGTTDWIDAEVYDE